MDGRQNIVQHTIRSTEKARELGRRGGIRSGESKRKRKRFRETLFSLLQMPLKKGAKARSVTSFEGFKTANVDLQTRILVGVVNKAMHGDVKAAEFIRDTIGEKPTETFEDKTPQSPFILGTIPLEKIEEAEAKRRARIEADAKVGQN